MNESLNSPRVDIIVPVFNEAELFPLFYEVARTRIQTPWRMLVVYDYPEDTTAPVAQEIATRDPRVVPVYNTAHGIANAVRAGVAATRADAVFFIAVDLPEDLALTDQLMALFYSGYDIVSPSRYMAGGTRDSGKWHMRLLSRIASWTLYYLAGIPLHDATNGSKLYRRSFLTSITLESRVGWCIALELIAKAHRHGLRMVEVPSTQKPRAAGASKFKVLRWLPGYLHWYSYALLTRLTPRKQRSTISTQQ